MSRLLLLSGLIAAWCVAGAASGVHAQEPARYERARAAFSGEDARAFERLVARAREQGLPVDPLVDKALEGAAKGVPPGRVLAVLEELATGLARARGLLAASGFQPAPPDIAAVADGLRRGVPEHAVRELSAGAQPGEPIALAVHTLADLLERGVPVAMALDVLTAWRGQGAQTAELVELPAAIERLMRQGVLPSQAAQAVAAAMRAGRGPGAAGPPGGFPPARGRGPGADGPPIPPGAGPPGDKGGRGKKSGS